MLYLYLSKLTSSSADYQTFPTLFELEPVAGKKVTLDFTVPELSVAVKSTDSQGALSQIKEIIDAFAKDYPEEKIERTVDVSDIGTVDYICSPSDMETILNILSDWETAKSAGIVFLPQRSPQLIVRSGYLSSYHFYLDFNWKEFLNTRFSIYLLRPMARESSISG